MFKKSVSLALAFYFGLFGLYGSFEPQVLKAIEDQVVITQTVTAEITVTSPSNVTMSPSIAGITGGSATGTAKWTVVTNNNTGFLVTHKASSTSMLGDTQGDSFVAYTPSTATGTPDYTWSVAASDAEFGYTVQTQTDGDLVALFRDNGTLCHTGSNNTYNKCWKDASTTAESIVNRSSETSSSGELITVDYQAQSGSSAFTVEDTYTATTTVTVTIN